MGDGDQSGHVEQLISAAAVRDAIRSQCQLVETSVDGRPITVVPILDAAIFYAADFMMEYKGEAYLAPVKISSYSEGWEDQKPELLTPIKDGTDIILLDTVIDTGHTIMEAVKLLPRRPTMIFAMVVKVDKLDPALGDLEIPPYCRHHVKGDPWLVGYGLDNGGLHRGLGYIGAWKRGN